MLEKTRGVPNQEDASCRRGRLAVFLTALCLLTPALGVLRDARGQAEQEGGGTRELFEAAIDAMGGQAYLDVKDITSDGQSFFFNNRGESSGLIKFTDYTKLPDKSRFELGNKKKEREVTVFDLEKGEGWILEGDGEAKPATPDDMRDFRAAADHSIDNIFHFRWKDPQNKLFYLGPGKGADVAYDMVQMLDPVNDEVVVYFDRASKLPAKIESWRINERGIKVRDTDEYSQWHRIQGVLTPLRIDSYTNGRRRAQQFFLKVAYNSGIKDDFFSKPVYKKK
jgi:hypothetical protein